MILDEFFVTPDYMDDEEDGEKVFSEEDKQIILNVLQKKAAKKHRMRVAAFGELLRSKGFIWLATSHNIMGGWQQAGNVIRIEAESPWMCDMEDMWRHNPEVAEYVSRNMKKPNGEEWEYQDRRQELVFIGQELKHEKIQMVLDQCLLTDEEMLQGPESWKKSMADCDQIQLSLVDDTIRWTIEEIHEDENKTKPGLDPQRLKINSFK